MKQQNKYCPMSANSDGIFGYCGSACAWYTDAGCAIMVLAIRPCANLHELQDMVKTPDEDALNIPF